MNSIDEPLFMQHRRKALAATGRTPEGAPLAPPDNVGAQQALEMPQAGAAYGSAAMSAAGKPIAQVGVGGSLNDPVSGKPLAEMTGQQKMNRRVGMDGKRLPESPFFKTQARGRYL